MLCEGLARHCGFGFKRCGVKLFQSQIPFFVLSAFLKKEATAGVGGGSFLKNQATDLMVSPKALIRRSISARSLMKGGASWMVSAP